MELNDKDIRAGLKFITKDKEPFFRTSYYPPFFQTNEPLYLYYPYFKLQDARVLTVTGSGDHVLEAISRGAKEITAFDQNRFAYYVTALKIAGVKGLEYSEFVDFFGYLDFKYAFEQNIYSKLIAPHLNPETRLFWDQIYAKALDKNILLKDSYLCAAPESAANFNYQSYLSKEGYFKTRENLGKVHLSFLSTKLYSLPMYLSKDKPYDTMFLSNIYDWLEEYQQGVFPAFIKYILAPYLKDDGRCASYCIFNDKHIVSTETFERGFREIFARDSQNQIVVYTYTKK